MAGAGAPNEVGIVVKVRGLPEAQRDLDSLVARVNKGADQVQQQGAQRQAQAEQAGGSGGGGAGGRGGTQTSTIAGGAFLGSLAAQMAQRSFSALSQGLAQSFDPNMTQFEKDLGMARARADMAPVGGPILAARLQALNQVPLGMAQGTSSQMNQIFGPAARAIGLANPNKSEDELKDIIKNQLGEQIKELARVLSAGERGREVGSQVVADIVSELMKDETVRTAKLTDEDTTGFENMIDKLNTLIDVSAKGTAVFVEWLGIYERTEDQKLRTMQETRDAWQQFTGR